MPYFYTCARLPPIKKHSRLWILAIVGRLNDPDVSLLPSISEAPEPNRALVTSTSDSVIIPATRELQVNAIFFERWLSFFHSRRNGQETSP